MTDRRIAEDGEQIAADVAIADQDRRGRVAFTEVIDASALTGVKRHKDGYLAGRVKAARTGIQIYTGDEMDWPEKERVAVYRPLDEVMRMDSLASYKGKPITDGHPGERVTAENWNSFARGTVMGVQRDGEAVQIDLTVSAKSLVDKLESGTARQLSAGYVAKIDRTPGVTEDGTPYDAIQRDIYIDHIAVVPAGRAGDEFRIGDGAAKWGAAPIYPEKSRKKETEMSDALKTVVLGDKAAQVAVADAAIIEQFKADQAKAVTDAAKIHADAIAAKDKEIATKDAKIAELEGKILSDDDKAKMVADRVALETTAAKITDQVKPSGMTDAALRKAVVVAKLGDEAVTGKSEAYIDARFDILAEEASKADPVADAISRGVVSHDGMTVADKAYAESLINLQTAYRGEPVKKEA
ncbi:DUF2213 domain-containing protein [Roseovarius mucosus]|uniref:DUF2213 domain-containing protein n=1 Tax=Roseovarius mucosus TaxID=215743 RepID=UPI0035CF7158